jgi:hypothetical protein
VAQVSRRETRIADPAPDIREREWKPGERSRHAADELNIPRAPAEEEAPAEPGETSGERTPGFAGPPAPAH